MTILLNVDEAREVRIEAYGALLTVPTPQVIKRDMFVYLFIYNYITS